MKINYHTHHRLCKHAAGEAEDYVKEAIKNKFEIIGMSDHAPNSLVNDQGVRMDLSEFNEYLLDIEDSQLKYSNEITILKGIEVEFFYNHEEYYKFLRENLDYLIHGQHYISLTNQMEDLISSFDLTSKEEIMKYAEYIEAAMASNNFDIFAHPDLYMYGYVDFDDNAKAVAIRICQAAIKHGAVLEYNANGYRRGKVKTKNGYINRYPRNEFWEIVKEYDCRTIFSSDCHTPNFLYDDVIKKAEQDYKKIGLNNVEILHLKTK